MRNQLMMIFVGTIAVFGGCTANQQPSQQTANPAARSSVSPLNGNDETTIEMPPRDLVAAVRKIVASPPQSLPIEQEREGVIVTGWKEFPGDWHILRRWEERTRYIIRVSPDWNEPLKRSHLQVTTQTEQRATQGQRWTADAGLDRPERGEEMLKLIQAGVK